jgi:hypothetical protein
VRTCWNKSAIATIGVVMLGMTSRAETTVASENSVVGVCTVVGSPSPGVVTVGAGTTVLSAFTAGGPTSHGRVSAAVFVDAPSNPGTGVAAGTLTVFGVGPFDDWVMSPSPCFTRCATT